MTDKSKPPIEFTVTWTQTVRVVVEKYTSASDAKRIAKNVADCLFDREEDVVAERREDVPMDVHSGGQGTVALGLATARIRELEAKLKLEQERRERRERRHRSRIEKATKGMT